MGVDAALIKAAMKRNQRAKACFTQFDKDNSGAVDQYEVLVLLSELGLIDGLKTDPVTFLAGVFAKHDANSDGVLSFDEFRGFYNAAVDDSVGKRAGNKRVSAGDRKKAEIAAKQLDSKKSGKHPEFPNVESATTEQVTSFSQRLNSQLTHKQQKERFKIFGLIDRDRSGTIVFGELTEYVRGGPSWGNGFGGLNLKKKVMSDTELQGIWVKLDLGKGFLKSDQFGAFMKLGQGDAGPTQQGDARPTWAGATWKERVTLGRNRVTLGRRSMRPSLANWKGGWKGALAWKAPKK